MNAREITFAMLIAVAQPLFAQSDVEVADLQAELESGGVTIATASGNGNSSGSAVEGSLVNQNALERHIDIYLSRPIYLKNRGAGQNMIATQVVLRDGGYYSDGRRSFITLKPKVQTRVTFVAYCADFERENPTSSDQFDVGVVPPVLTNVMKRIVDRSKVSPNTDITRAAQVAVWLAQGESPEAVRRKFPFTESEEELARKLVGTSAPSPQSRFEVPAYTRRQVAELPRVPTGDWRVAGNWSKLKTGMSQDQVIKFLGQPTSRSFIGRSGYFYYEGYVDSVGAAITGNIFFDSNGQAAIVNPPVW